jgi:vacuolar-type H+-ATPase subunit H
MLKDLRRKKDIILKARSIAEEIIHRYPPEADEVKPGESEADLKKKRRKLNKVLQQGRADITRTQREMSLGIYGKAKFYKTIQDTMLNRGYKESSARLIIEELIGKF